MKKTCPLLVPIVLLFLEAAAYGMVYTWTDSAGTRHYTNKEYEIPARYRARVKSLYQDQSDVGALQQGVARPEVQIPMPVQQATPGAPIQAIPPVIAPAPQYKPSERALKKARRRWEAED